MIRSFEGFMNNATTEEYQNFLKTKIEVSPFVEEHKYSEEGYGLPVEMVREMTIFDKLHLLKEVSALAGGKYEFEKYRKPVRRYFFENYVMNFEAISFKENKYEDDMFFCRSLHRIFCERIQGIRSYEDFLRVARSEQFKGDENLKQEEIDKLLMLHPETIDKMSLNDRLALYNDLENRATSTIVIHHNHSAWPTQYFYIDGYKVSILSRARSTMGLNGFLAHIEEIWREEIEKADI